MSNLTPLLEIAKELLKPAGNKGMHVDDIAEKAMKNNQIMYLPAPELSRKLQAALTLCASILVLGFMGCATPVSHRNIALSTYDKDTEYGLEENPSGYGLTIYFSRYQFIPESTSVATSCTTMLTAIAYEISETKGKKINPINEQKIRLSMGRNGFSGITSCQAFAAIEYAQ